MKILMLSNAGSVHTQRWVKALAEHGNDIMLFTLSCNYDKGFFNSFDNVFVKEYDYRHRGTSFKNRILQRFELLFVVKYVKQLIKDFQPDIVHAHYAVDYGTIAALSGFHPFVLSVWGSDIYGDPQLSFLSKQTLRYKLRKADMILSTSRAMAKETNKYTSKNIEITPFGVDTSFFCPATVTRNDAFVVGNVKSLEPIYGIDTLIRAFKIISDNNPQRNIVLKIVGDGSQYASLKTLAETLKIEDKVIFVGRVPNGDLPVYYNSFDVAVFLSNKESFGVVAVEAMSCECPVVVSDAYGFTEVVEDNITGFVVPKRDAEATATAIQKFIDDPDLRKKMGATGRKHVQRVFEWNENVKTMLGYYKELIDNK